MIWKLNAWGIGGTQSARPRAFEPSGAFGRNQAVIAPGTGLGEAGLYWDGGPA